MPKGESYDDERNQVLLIYDRHGGQHIAAALIYL